MRGQKVKNVFFTVQIKFQRITKAAIVLGGKTATANKVSVEFSEICQTVGCGRAGKHSTRERFEVIGY